MVYKRTFKKPLNTRGKLACAVFFPLHPN